MLFDEVYNDFVILFLLMMYFIDDIYIHFFSLFQKNVLALSCLPQIFNFPHMP